MKVLVCLPAYNEESALTNLLRRINDHLEEYSLTYEVILIDDGSTDRTVEVAESARSFVDLEVVRHGTNRGLGDAIVTGLRYALEIADDRDVIVTMDSDNSHTPGLILRMVRLIQEGNDVVIASRYASGANIRGVSLSRRLLSYGASLLCRLLFPTKNVKDYTSGYRAYKVPIIREAFIKFGNRFISQNGFSCMIEILLNLRSMDAIIAEVPLILRYDMKEGASKMKVLRTIKQSITLLLYKRVRSNY